ncbi:hypothetical protein A3D11_02780 [Candidatus Peribacteria bacterium RIFCSPHIGHO2_02_FULL_49_16]|nr:MAG: hypothetical protein A2880_01780 [Candidatus Peribacteria bacterium RIFCSPHIGHO2_01_FULL_49_38]OGJ58517.1 MAG: hypothetical protein A3D11_02780 [Candidatus Peribacteria bacterium RIFCSPHIGHO2_02_FULL_49_16]
MSGTGTKKISRTVHPDISAVRMLEEQQKGRIEEQRKAFLRKEEEHTRLLLKKKQTAITEEEEALSVRISEEKHLLQQELDARVREAFATTANFEKSCAGKIEGVVASLVTHIQDPAFLSSL